MVKSAYERSGESRGADPASNGPFRSEGISKRSEQIYPKAPFWGFWRLGMNRTVIERVVHDDVEVDSRPLRFADSVFFFSHISTLYMENHAAPSWLPYPKKHFVFNFASVASNQLDSEEVAVSSLMTLVCW